LTIKVAWLAKRRRPPYGWVKIKSRPFQIGSNNGGMNKKKPALGRRAGNNGKW